MKPKHTTSNSVNPALLPVLDGCITKTFSKGSALLYQGEVPRTAFVIKEGIIKAYSITQQGDERIVTFHAAGEVFPSIWLFQKASSSLYYYEALTDCEVWVVNRETLIEYIYSNPEATKAMLDHYVTSYAASLVRITALEQAKAREKILFTLYYLMQRYGKEIVPGLFSINLDLTHQMIADLVGLTRETTAGELSALKKQKLLSYKRQRYLIKKEFLLKLIGEDSFRDIVI